MACRLILVTLTAVVIAFGLAPNCHASILTVFAGGIADDYNGPFKQEAKYGYGSTQASIYSELIDGTVVSEAFSEASVGSVFSYEFGAVAAVRDGGYASTTAGVNYSDKVLFSGTTDRAISLTFQVEGYFEGGGGNVQATAYGDSVAGPSVAMFGWNPIGGVSYMGWDGTPVYGSVALGVELHEALVTWTYGPFDNPDEIDIGFVAQVGSCEARSPNGDAASSVGDTDPARLPFGGKLVSLVFADTGLTPEEEGIEFSFASGAASPNTAPVPEPTSLVLWSGLGVMGLIAARRRRLAQGGF